jgi:HAD superfamily hydrolase (TIGR01490 family)
LAEDTEIGTPVGANPSAAAFFDLDGTLVIGQTQVLLVMFLRSRRIISLAFLVGTGLWFLAYKMGLVRVTQEARAKGAQVLRGLKVAEAQRLMASFADEVMMPRIHAAAVAALREHQVKGDKVVVLSAALDPIVKALCDRLGVAEYVAAPCEIEDCRYTGRLSGRTPYGELKADVAAEMMARWGVDPAACWAYADHVTDLALLRSVGHPVAVHPKPGLLEASKASGWTVLP